MRIEDIKNDLKIIEDCEAHAQKLRVEMKLPADHKRVVSLLQKADKVRQKYMPIFNRLEIEVDIMIHAQ